MGFRFFKSYLEKKFELEGGDDRDFDCLQSIIDLSWHCSGQYKAHLTSLRKWAYAQISGFGTK